MAPELISGTKADAKVDQYALAVMTYELLAGRKPFDGPTPAAVMIACSADTFGPATAAARLLYTGGVCIFAHVDRA